ncbi:hypothetical protein [Agrobacterium pusense]|uniref:hypothetical protein n=1 Tax=Agrobacterium pusense TaxID=648995 RepID=UPI0018E5076D|nr:hypothetical protein [Agrobacterium pusense]
MSTTTATLGSVTFPTSSIEATLRADLVDAIKNEAAMKGIVLPSSIAAISSMPVPIDSLVVVSILCNVEPTLGFLLPDKVVKSGGYSSVDEAIQQLLPKIEDRWKKQKGIKV